MKDDHDQSSESLAGASESDAPAAAEAFDPLSDLLRTVKLKGALFFMIDATSPWCVEVPEAAEFAGIILPSARHIVSYHIAVEGSGVASAPGLEPKPFDAGDIIVYPHADAYYMASAPGVPPELNHAQTLQFFREVAAGNLPFVIPEGGGQAPPAKFICGFLGCDMSPFNPLFDSLPRLLQIRRPAKGRRDLLDQLVALTITEMQRPRVGGDSIRLGLSELMFIELLRRHLESLAPAGPGWLAGLRDAKVGRALGLFHAQPARDWTLEELAREIGISRSVLAERFARFVGETPMRYLTRWRMQLAARLLTDGNAKVASIAEDVGFRSESAFSRGFKKETGLSPAEWRRANSDASANSRRG